MARSRPGLRWKSWALALTIVLVALPVGVAGATTRLSVKTSALPPGRGDRSYSAALTSTGGHPGFRWSASGLPGGLALSGPTIKGTPSQGGTFTVTVKVTDSTGRAASRRLSLVVLNPGQVGLMDLLNHDRSTGGLRPLGWDVDLSAATQNWAVHMAQHGLAHDLSGWQPPCAKAPGTSWGENVGYGASLADIEAMFMASPHHRPNIMSARFTRAITAVVYAGGTYWVVQRFTQGC